MTNWTVSIEPGTYSADWVCWERKLMRKILETAILSAILVPACQSQGLPDQLNFLSSNRTGIHLYGVSAFVGHSVLDFPGATSLRSRTNYGASGTLGWQKLRGQTNISARYSGGFFGDPENSNFNHFNQSAAFSVSRPLGRKWGVVAGGSVVDTSLSQYLFEPSTLGTISQTPASFDDLAAAFSVGQYSSSEAALKLNGSPALYSPTRAVLLGSSFLSYSVRASLSYAHSSRLQFQFGSFAIGGYHRRDNLADSTTIPNYVMPRSLGGDASAQMSYSLSPRTDFGVGVTQTYVTNRYQKSTSTSATASLGRKMGRNWFLRVYGGEAFNEDVQQASGTPLSRLTVGGGSIGFQTYGNTLVASYSRSASDVSSSTVGKNTMISAAWSWQRPHSSWGVHAGYGRNEISGTGYTTISGWQASVGFSQRLGWNLMLAANYSYLRSRGAYFSTLQEVNFNAVRMSISWAPQQRRPSVGVIETPARKGHS